MPSVKLIQPKSSILKRSRFVSFDEFSHFSSDRRPLATMVSMKLHNNCVDHGVQVPHQHHFEECFASISCCPMLYYHLNGIHLFVILEVLSSTEIAYREGSFFLTFSFPFPPCFLVTIIYCVTYVSSTWYLSLNHCKIIFLWGQKEYIWYHLRLSYQIYVGVVPTSTPSEPSFDIF